MTVALLLRNKPAGVFHINLEASVSDCIGLLNQKGVGALLVCDRSQVIEGIVSERDVLRAAYANRCQICEMPVREIMTPKGRLVTAQKTDTIETVMNLMTGNRIRHIPIMEEGRPIGMISIGDVVKALLDLSATENKELKDYISGSYMPV